MAKPDLVADVTRAARIAKRVFTGDLSLTDVILNRNPVRAAQDGEPRCEKTPGCIGPLNHAEGCIFEGQTEEEAPPSG